MNELAPRWLDPDDAARYIGVRVHELRGLLKAGKLPPPSLHLGPRKPRYDRLALDTALGGEAASDLTGEAVAHAIHKIETQSRQDRPKSPGRRDGKNLRLSAA